MPAPVSALMTRWLNNNGDTATFIDFDTRRRAFSSVALDYESELGGKIDVDVTHSPRGILSSVVRWVDVKAFFFGSGFGRDRRGWSYL